MWAISLTLSFARPSVEAEKCALISRSRGHTNFRLGLFYHRWPFSSKLIITTQTSAPTPSAAQFCPNRVLTSAITRTNWRSSYRREKSKRPTKQPADVYPMGSSALAGTERNRITLRVIFSVSLPFPKRIDSVDFTHPTLSRPYRHRRGTEAGSVMF